MVRAFPVKSNQEPPRVVSRARGSLLGISSFAYLLICVGFPLSPTDPNIRTR